MRACLSFPACLILATTVGLSAAVTFVLPVFGDDSEARERVILMNSGRILTGFASRNAGGWLVEQSNGRVQVPGEQVKIVADSLVDAYRKQRDSVVEPTPATHLALAQWCISYRLHGEARDELRKCLKLDPDDSSARKLLRRLDDMLDPPMDKRAGPAERAPLRSPEGFLVPDAESLGGLSTDAALSFTQRIQPLLVNKCGNASCHGTTSHTEKSSGFHLMPVRSGTNAHRLYTERNLAEVVRYIDLQEPSLSPLVAIPQGAHGGTAGVFHGTNGNAQIKMLRAWIKTVAAEKRSEEEELADRPSIFNKSRVTALPPRELVADPGAEALEANSPGNVGTRTVEDAAVKADKTLVRTVPNPNAVIPASGKDARGNRDEKPAAAAAATTAEKIDAFDPDVFNRQFHASPRR